MASCVVVVTGGGGFLGQHVIKHLQLYAPWVTEIRVLDKIAYKQKLKGFTQTIPMKIYTEDITSDAAVCEVFRGADSVIHLASIVDSRFQPNVELMNKVNVEGTRTVIEACISENVPHLVNCGSVSSYMTWKNVINGNENQVSHREDCLIRDYGISKAKAEKLVLRANGKQLKNGNVLKTLSVVPSTMYGELDMNITVTSLKIAQSQGGKFPRLGSGTNKEMYSYGGNVAWGFVCALKALRENDDAAGEYFFMNDDTPHVSVQKILLPIFKEFGFKLSKFYVPWFMIIVLIAMLQLICLLISPLKKISFHPSVAAVKFCCTDFFLNYHKATTFLKYKPKYTYDESMKMTSDWAKTYFEENENE